MNIFFFIFFCGSLFNCWSHACTRSTKQHSDDLLCYSLEIIVNLRWLIPFLLSVTRLREWYLMLRENAQKRFFSASKDLRRTELTGPINMQRADLLFASHKEINRPKKNSSWLSGNSHFKKFIRKYFSKKEWIKAISEKLILNLAKFVMLLIVLYVKVTFFSFENYQSLN